MQSPLLLWLLVLSLALAALAVVAYLMVRQLGYLMQNSRMLAPKSEAVGPRVGEDVSCEFKDLLATASDKKTFLLFGSSDCSVCRHLKTQRLEGLLEAWGGETEFVAAFDEEEAGVPAELKEGQYQNLFGLKEVRDRLGIDYVPFSVVLDGRMRVLAKGLVNSLGQFEGVLSAAKQRA